MLRVEIPIIIIITIPIQTIEAINRINLEWYYTFFVLMCR